MKKDVYERYHYNPVDIEMMRLEEEYIKNEKRFELVLKCMTIPVVLLIVCSGIKIYQMVLIYINFLTGA